MSGWEKIYESADGQSVNLRKALLESSGIAAVVVSKQDRSYLFGHLELFVHTDDYIRALQVIEQAEG
jgi:hypothetical protein